MIKAIVAGLLGAAVVVCFATSVDANRATQAELEAVNGLGPSISTKILDERRKGTFKNWQDLIDRVKGIGQSNAAKFSAEGLTVNGASYQAAPPAAKADKAKGAEPKASAPAKQ
jgi:competence protein ComEA